MNVSYSGQPRRHEPSFDNPSFYSQGPEQPSPYPQDFLMSQERIDPSAGIQHEATGPEGWISGFQQRRFGRPGSGHFSTDQFHPPVPPDRQLPSSGPRMSTFGRDFERVYERTSEQSSYGTALNQAQIFDEHRPLTDRTSAYGTSQDPFSQLPGRTLPPPGQQIAVPSSGAVPTTTVGYDRNLGAYQNSSYYQGQPPYR